MKQNSGGRGMGDSEMDPSELWCQLGLLVIESRQPHASRKGWREGPHCLLKKSKGTHHCSPSANPLCKRKDGISREIRSLGKNNVPVCIEVVMLPECDKHDHKMDISHGINKGQYILLEQWKFQVLPKSGEELSVEIPSLFQAVKSYLYFSQLSAWLNQTHGSAPKAVEYRVSPPAEFCTNTFQESPELHRFPICTQQYYNIQVTVAALPRQRKLVSLPCPDSVPISTAASMPVQRRRISSPVTEGACASAARSSPCTSLSPRSGSPNLGACCASYVNYPDVKWREDGGVMDGGVMVQQLYQPREFSRQPRDFPHQPRDFPHQPRDFPRSKTYKDFHSDDSSDCSESSTLTIKSKNTANAVTLSSQRIFSSSPSCQSFIENTASPRFYLPHIQAPVSSLSSSSDSSQNGNRDTIFSSHRPSPPIDFTPSRDVDSLSRKLATKLSFEPLPAFELEAHVSKSVQVDIPFPVVKSKHYTKAYRDNVDTARESDDSSPDSVQKELYPLQNELSLRTDTCSSTVPYMVNTGNECSNGAKSYALHTQGISNGSSQQSFTNGVTPHSDSKDNRGDTGHNGTTETNGYSRVELEQDPVFHVTKTPEKPLKSIMVKHLQNVQSKQTTSTTAVKSRVPSEEERITFRKALCKSSAAVFSSTGLPMQSSPAPIKRLGRTSFDFDANLTCCKAIKNSLSCVNLEEYKTTTNEEEIEKSRKQRMYSTSAPASTNSLLGNFEESLLNGRIEPCGAVEGFCVDIGASGSFCPSHVTVPMTAFFFKLSEDNAPSPYLGHVNLDSVGKRGYHVPNKGTIQVTLFNPNKTVVKMFVLTYDLSDMPPHCTTFLRQRTLYKPVNGSPCDTQDALHYLRYLIHLRVASTKSKKLYLHSDIRMIFARDKFEYDSRIANYEYRSLTEGPVNPKYSPKK